MTVTGPAYFTRRNIRITVTDEEVNNGRLKYWILLRREKWIISSVYVLSFKCSIIYIYCGDATFQIYDLVYTDRVWTAMCAYLLCNIWNSCHFRLFCLIQLWLQCTYCIQYNCYIYMQFLYKELFAESPQFSSIFRIEKLFYKMKGEYKIIINVFIKNIGDLVNLERKEQMKNILQVCLLAIMIWDYVICILWEIRFWDIECFRRKENILYFFRIMCFAVIWQWNALKVRDSFSVGNNKIVVRLRGRKQQAFTKGIQTVLETCYLVIS